MIDIKNLIPYLVTAAIMLVSCKKDDTENAVSKDTSLSFTVDGTYNGTLVYTHLNSLPTVAFTFTEAVDPNTLSGAIKLSNSAGQQVAYSTELSNQDKSLSISPEAALQGFSTYTLSVSGSLRTKSGGKVVNPVNITLKTGLNETDKFPRIPDEELLTLVQRQTFKYFWDFAHPVSGLARERNTSGEVVTTGGSGFGIMALVTGIHRNFISRQEGLERMQKIVGFLKTKADRFHGAFPHWLNGTTGAVQPFSAKDDGADLVETSLLMQGLLTARQYFNGSSTAETTLRADINELWNAVDWNWFRKGAENKLYWHWSPNHQWGMNMEIRGWNEALITYVLAASSNTHSIPKAVYDEGWAANGAIRNGASYYGIQLPLGPANGGPLFFSHYSFLGLNPMGLTDAYANYETQNKAHTLIHYQYSKANPKEYYGYSEDAWGLTASDDVNGYLAHEPNNDTGVISPTAALSSFPYTPNESMTALKFFYYKLGDKIWREYGFVDAFSMHHAWFADSHLAIDQGPIIIMIENYRSGLLWDLFMSAPEIKAGLRKLGFSSPKI